MDLEKQKRFLIRLAYFAAIAALVYVGLKYLLPIVMPFLLAFIIVWMLRKPAQWLAEKLHIPGKYTTALLLLVFYVILFGLISLLGVSLFSLIKDAIPSLPSLYRDELLPALKVAADFVEQSLSRFDPSVVAAVEGIFTQVSQNIESMLLRFSGAAVSWASNVLLGFPALIIEIVLLITSSFFLGTDYDRVMGYLYSHMPKKVKDTVRSVWYKLAGSLWIYIRSYALLLLVTFTELLVGLSILGVPYASIIAAGIALFDLMPILGTGGVLIPWVVIAAVMGNYGMALGVAALYIVITIVRNYLEPKLVGKQIGLHPLATLMALFIGSQLFGLAGLFGFPVALSVYVQLRRGKPAEKPEAE